MCMYIAPERTQQLVLTMGRRTSVERVTAAMPIIALSEQRCKLCCCICRLQACNSQTVLLLVSMPRASVQRLIGRPMGSVEACKSLDSRASCSS